MISQSTKKSLQRFYMHFSTTDVECFSYRPDQPSYHEKEL